MISVEFAPNEQKADAKAGLHLMMKPWKWRRGAHLGICKTRIKRMFFDKNWNVHFFFSGRAGLYFLLKALSLPKNSEILVQAFTCEAVVLPIKALDLSPIYVDIQENDFSMNIDDLKKKYTHKAKVIILQHTFGIVPEQRDEILEFAKAKKISVIEDMAHGMNLPKDKLSKKNHYLLSFGRSKAYSSVFGGAVVSHNKQVTTELRKIAKKLDYPSQLNLLRLLMYKIGAPFIKATYGFFIGKIVHALFKTTQLIIPETSQKEKKGEYDLMHSRKFPNIAAYLLDLQLKRFNDVKARRNISVALYNAALGVPHEYTNSLLRYPITSTKRDKIVEKARQQGVYLGVWYDQVVGPKGVQLDKVDYKLGSCPSAEKISKNIVNLPTSLPENKVHTVINIIKPFL